MLKSLILSIYMSLYFGFLYVIHSSSIKKKPEFEIEIIIHSIEKGLVRTDFNPGFGKKKVQRLAYLLSLRDTHDYFYLWGMAALQKYKKKHEECNFNVSEYVDIPAIFESECNDLAGSVRYYNGFGSDYFGSPSHLVRFM